MAARSAVSSGLASRYATALFELAQKQDVVDVVLRDLNELDRAIDGSADLQRLILSPIITRDEHVAALGALGERMGFHALTAQFVGTLAKNRRVFSLRQMIQAYRAEVARSRGEVDAEVISAVALDEAQLDQVRSSVAGFAKAPVNLASRVDPSLLGGLVVRVGSRMVDASLKNKLQQLETSLRGLS